MSVARRIAVGLRAAALAVALVTTLGACASGLRSSEAAPVVYVLNAPAGVAGGEALPATLQVLQALARPGYTSDRVVLLRSDRSLDVYAGSRWAGELPVVVGAAAIDAVRGSGAFRAVYDDTAPFAPDYTLRVTIRRFDAEYAAASTARNPESAAAPTVVVALDVMVGRRRDRAVLSSFELRATRAAAANRMTDVVAAHEAALGEALQQLVVQLRAAIAQDFRTSTTPSSP